MTSDDLEKCGAFDLSLESDLPVFIDPFLLFNSPKAEYQDLHQEILKYLMHLRDLSIRGNVDDGTLRNLYCFSEVRQNWLGFTFMGNGGSGLGMAFARALNESLQDIFSNFGNEQITHGSHLEKVSLIRGHVGRDNMSDFTTNLIKKFLLEYTEAFAKLHIDERFTADVRVPKAYFNFQTESWAEATYRLPVFIKNGKHDYVLLTPTDMLTRENLWISSAELRSKFEAIPESITDGELRSRVNAYFAKALGRRPTKQDRSEAIEKTLREFPELIDYYIRLKEEQGDLAAEQSLLRVRDAEKTFRVAAEAASLGLASSTEFYETPLNSYADALRRVQFFKQYVENQDGYLLINPKSGRLGTEKDVQLFFGLVWFGSPFDVNREVNNGRGPVDFKTSFGASDKSLIELKLASNTSLERNLRNQVAVYEAANSTENSIKLIVCYTAHDQSKVKRVLAKLDLETAENIVVVDARRDNKPSGSKA
ncbi:hypothetical protein [Pseudonocardia sp. MH-G8]|uniref:hypothetical protein n=1 Tax=Pseudonocardia sp. MH-G8 TaxID=1854588 RepID=UPI0018EA1315|nr:hypothetical protein [Pseudonocardia sp. MH-G8]